MPGRHGVRGGADVSASEDDVESNSDSVFYFHLSGQLLTRLPTYVTAQNISSSHLY